jgi:hypothetical protein
MFGPRVLAFPPSARVIAACVPLLSWPYRRAADFRGFRDCRDIDRHRRRPGIDVGSAAPAAAIVADHQQAESSEGGGMSNIMYAWKWLKDNDAPNWFAVAFSLIVWPIILYWLGNRKRQGVRHLEVFPHVIPLTIGNQQVPGVELEFANLTGTIVYLNRVRLHQSCCRKFDIATVSHSRKDDKKQSETECIHRGAPVQENCWRPK